MSFASRVEQRLRRDFFRWRHQHAVQSVLTTAPVVAGSLPFTLLSMVQKRDVVSYLVAVKSFVHFANPRRVVIVCDPSIDAGDKDILRRHIPHVEFRSADEFTHPEIPRGGTWERLLAICAYAETDYVVQLDADTVTVKPVAEVSDAIREQQGFVLGETSNQTLMSLQATSAYARRDFDPHGHIQGCAEACMDSVGLPDASLYVRGCSGFTGFPPDRTMKERLLMFSGCMSRQLGMQRWAAWGTEQVTSNYLVANAGNTKVLPFPKYGTPNVMNEETAFLHFIGSMRFINSKYEKTSREAIRRISGLASHPA